MIYPFMDEPVFPSVEESSIALIAIWVCACIRLKVLYQVGPCEANQPQAAIPGYICQLTANVISLGIVADT